MLVRRRRLWVAVEVKTRRGHPAPERTVTPNQRERVRAALQSLACHLRPEPRALRVDIAAVVWSRGAWEVRTFPGMPWSPPTSQQRRRT